MFSWRNKKNISTFGLKKSTSTCFHGRNKKNTVDSHYLDLTYFERLSRSEILVPVFTCKSKNRYVTKYCGKEEKLLLKSNFSSFPQYFQYVSNFKSQVTYSFVKCGYSIYCFPHFCNSDISRYGYLKVFQRVPWNSR